MSYVKVMTENETPAVEKQMDIQFEIRDIACSALNIELRNEKHK